MIAPKLNLKGEQQDGILSKINGRILKANLGWSQLERNFVSHHKEICCSIQWRRGWGCSRIP